MNPFGLFRSSGLYRDPFGHQSRHSPYGFQCESCDIDEYGDHTCMCVQVLQLPAQVQLQEEAVLAMTKGGGCGCPDCPLDIYGYGGGGYSGYPL
jgi:hypothetical protein